MQTPKTFIVALAAFTAAITAGYRFKSDHPVPEKNNSKSAGIAVVELFTSEGCSSCPSADKTVEKLLSKHLENVYVLCFHVDYWNRLGWTDPFSQSLFTARQGKYAGFFSLNSVYTPQVVVNGSAQFVGSDENKLNAQVQKELNKEPKSTLTISTKRTNNTLTVTYVTTNQNNALLNLALVQPEATTVVKKGENGGKTLHHVNIVRALRTVDINEKGYLSIEIPKELENIPLKLIAYTQSKANFSVSGADQKTL